LPTHENCLTELGQILKTLPQLDNVGEQYFDKSFVSYIMICYILFAFEFLCFFLHVVRRKQIVLSEVETDLPSKEDKTDKSHPEC